MLISDRPGAKYQPGPGPGDHFLAGAGVLFLAGAGDFWCFSPTIFEIILQGFSERVMVAFYKQSGMKHR